MRLITSAAALLLGISLAAAAPAPQETGSPQPYENIDISDFSVRKKVDGTVTSVSFQLSGNNATNLACSASDPGFPSKVVRCGDSKYSFALYPGSESEFALRIYHELGTAVGFYGEGDIFTYCHAGGLGDLICTQQYQTTIVIDGH